ncbi:methylated-DNA--[protein]-cysteine S-methyltransferase [Ferrovibrio sp.]|uniref:methylated-DNA--[protein]-cysteine S-methyltransferase n=1 Tax=Ferrovibrio sp. TaxID=1917215 RepID=UPI001B5404C7|nr:methylated-DNA--[protein]-cysteine S-methyltransferase [Ferrovibrio sp.]MBP7063103.1 methylated-DNA--[protein]-cysteine S-methyltransferase [Ferrovibrio sp.]
MEPSIRRLVTQSPFGPLTLTERDAALVALDWGRLPESDGPSPLLSAAAEQLEDYFDGRLKRFDLAAMPRGTDFQIRVWRALQAIPYGETMTYGEIARALKSSARAVGMACGANPLPIIVPCHRVLAENGLGGFSGLGGIATKRRLLALENDAAMPRRQPSLFDLPLFSYSGATAV